MKNSFFPRLAAPVLLAAVLLFTGQGCLRQPSAEVIKASQPITLNYWRVFDDTDAFAAIVQEYNQLHPNIRIEYRKLNFTEYKKSVLDAIAENRGPDIVSLHNSWMKEWQPRLLPVPATLSVPFRKIQGTIKKEAVTVIRQEPGITVAKLKNDFIDVVATDVVLPTATDDPHVPFVDGIYGLPLSVDTPVLYYNRDILNNAGIASPAGDWKAFQEQVKKITQLDDTGAVIQSAAALGTSANVERSSDILAALMMQNGTQMTGSDGKASFEKFPPGTSGREFTPGAEALIFFTDFANTGKEVYTWNDKMPNSFEAFARGQTAYFVGYSYHLGPLRQANPKLSFGIAPFPQIAGNPPVNYANYWVESVTKATTHPNEAWDFVQFITAAEHAPKYLVATKKPTALRSLISSQLGDLDLSVFAAQLPTAKSWYHGSDAPAEERTFNEMIDQMLKGDLTPQRILELGASKVNQTIK